MADINITSLGTGGPKLPPIQINNDEGEQTPLARRPAEEQNQNSQPSQNVGSSDEGNTVGGNVNQFA
jgi:hypothetical protein